MTDKSEILRDNFSYGFTGMEEDAIFKSMDQWAKIQIMAYEIWVDAELHNDSSFNYGKTPEQLYDLFIQHQSQRP